MIEYAVVWTLSAREELAEVWMASPDRAAVTQTVTTIDRELSMDAGTAGNELSEGLRVLVIVPLRVLFSVRESERIVDVEKVIQIGTS